MSKHTKELKTTPGPWEWESHASEHAPGSEAMVWGPDGDAVAAVYGNLALGGAPSADARLIAAAPALLEALEALVNAADRHEWIEQTELSADGLGPALNAAHAALAKATEGA